jgi:hypothetical protein
MYQFLQIIAGNDYACPFKLMPLAGCGENTNNALTKILP